VHALRCSKDDEDIIEVKPPAWATEEPNPQPQMVESKFFPLVSAAHEFKTPLVVMLGYADLLRSGNLGPVNDKQQEVLGEIYESAERLQRVVQDLLLLWDLTASKAQNRDKRWSEAASVNENMEELFNFWISIAKQKEVRYEFCPAAGNPKVRVEPLRLQHIVSNVIENALHYTPRGGRVVLSVTQCFWDRRKKNSGTLFGMDRKANRKIRNAICIAVTDTGPGIASEHHADIFLDFVQLQGASSRGIGLGLAIARRLAEAHQGVIWVESELGKGSRFFLLLSQATNQ
jgi:signal transduction histidine kinase